MRFVTHRVDTACVDPAIVEIEQRADRDCIIDRFVGEARFVEAFDVGGLNGHGIAIHFAHKAKQSFLGIGEQRGFHIREDACNQFRAAEQFRRDRGVSFGSKRAGVQLGRVGGNQLADARRKRRGLAHHLLSESLEVRSGVDFVREHVQDLGIFRTCPLHHFNRASVVVIALMGFDIL